MPTTTRGRGYNRSRSTFGGYSGYSFGPGGSYGGGTSGTSYGRKSGKTGGSGTGGYKSVCCTCEQKINSYKTIWNQCKGTTTTSTPSPGTLNSFANWINKGAVVQTCTTAQVSRWARNTNKNFSAYNPSPSACKNVLAAKFGKNTIKAVCRTKGGSFLVATTPTIKGKSFTFPR